jgi:FkbM family methyltransferase
MTGPILALRNVAQLLFGHPLNRANRGAALARFVSWQVSARLMKSPIAFPFVNDTRLLARKGQSGATGNWYCGLHEPNDMGFVLHSLRRGDLMVDVGANVGSYTILAAGAVGANVIAIEPVPATFRDLAACVRLNDLAALVELHRLGLSDRPGTLPFTTHLDAGNYVVSQPSEHAIEVPVTTLDELIGTRTPTFIKIDVEGYELPVLRGAHETVQRPEVQAIILETNGLMEVRGFSSEDALSMLASAGYSACKYQAQSRTLTPILAGQALAERGNTIFVRDPDRIQALCSAAPTFRLVNGTI